MNKFLQKVSGNFMNFKFEDKFSKVKNKFLDFTNAHPEIFCLGLLAIACLLFLFCGLGLYPLLDVDETRYAVMSRDLIQSPDLNFLMLNGTPFLEKPPLYFWLVGSSIKLFGYFSSFVVRFPIALLSSFLIFFTYYVGKRIISRKFGMISAFILVSSMFFLILSHVAILDMVLTVFVTSALYCALLTHSCEENNKKYYWWYFYLFISLGFLTKGILALAIPLTIAFLYNLATKTLKDMFKPINIVPGLVILFVSTAPWHLLMYFKYGYQFIKEYFLIHHFGRFMGSEYIGRERPLLYFVPVFLLGFMPWTFIFIAFLIDGVKKLFNKFKLAQGNFFHKLAALFVATNNEQKLILFASISFAVIFLLFSSASTKLPTYILPIFPFAALLTGYYWWVSDERNEHEKSIYNTTLLFSAIFIIAAFAATVAYWFLPGEIQTKLDSFKDATIVALNLLAIFLVLRLNTKRALSIFSGYIFTMFFIVAISVSQIFNLVYTSGEDEIVQYSQISVRPDKSSQLVTFDFAVKPSALIKYPYYINFITNPDFQALDKILEYKNGPTFVIVKNKNFINNNKYRQELEKRLELIQTGEKYSLFVKDINNEYNNTNRTIISSPILN